MCECKTKVALWWLKLWKQKKVGLVLRKLLEILETIAVLEVNSFNQKKYIKLLEKQTPKKVYIFILGARESGKMNKNL